MFVYHPIFVSTLIALDLDAAVLKQIHDWLATQDIHPTIEEHGRKWYHRGPFRRPEIIREVYAIRDNHSSR